MYGIAVVVRTVVPELEDFLDPDPRCVLGVRFEGAAAEDQGVLQVLPGVDFETVHVECEASDFD
jgi:hypothetical protein